MHSKIPKWRDLQLSQADLNKLADEALECCDGILQCFRCRSLLFATISYWTYLSSDEIDYVLCEPCVDWLCLYAPSFKKYAKHCSTKR
jgi:hypothetical protein